MKIKDVKTMYVVLGFCGLLAVVIVFLFWLYAQEEYPRLAADLQECVEGKKNMYGNLDGYEPGVIWVKFNRNATKEGIKSLIESYGLTYSKIETRSNYMYVDVLVSVDKQIAWLCEFEENMIVNRTSLHPKMSLK